MHYRTAALKCTRRVVVLHSPLCSLCPAFWAVLFSGWVVFWVGCFLGGLFSVHEVQLFVFRSTAQTLDSNASEIITTTVELSRHDTELLQYNVMNG